MDDMISKISQILSTDEGQKGLQSIMSSLGMGGDKKDASPSSTGEPSAEASASVPEIDFKTISSIQQILSAMSVDDGDAALLRALKPHLSEERRGRVDDALRIMQLINALPLIQKSGLFGGLFGGDNQ